MGFFFSKQELETEKVHIRDRNIFSQQFIFFGKLATII
jgi:hypothetical protein